MKSCVDLFLKLLWTSAEPPEQTSDEQALLPAMHVHGVMTGMSAQLDATVHSSRQGARPMGRMGITKQLRQLWVLSGSSPCYCAGQPASPEKPEMGQCTCAPAGKAHSPSVWRRVTAQCAKLS